MTSDSVHDHDDQIAAPETDSVRDAGPTPDPAPAPAPVDETSTPPARSPKADQAVDFLVGLISRMDLEAAVVDVIEDERINIHLAGADAGRVIGKKGQTLDSLQFLVNKVVNRFPEGRRHVVLDVEGYKERRDESLASMAQRLADKANRTGKVITISPMPSRERRVIHLALAEVDNVTTRSDGEGTERRVRIIPQRRRSGQRR